MVLPLGTQLPSRFVVGHTTFYHFFQSQYHVTPGLLVVCWERPQLSRVDTHFVYYCKEVQKIYRASTIPHNSKEDAWPFVWRL